VSVLTDLTPHDWYRLVVLDRLDQEFGFTKKEHIFFEQSVGIRFHCEWFSTTGR
jgi:hypothetical protein